MPAYRQTDQLFVTCVAGRKNYVSTIISGGEIGVNRKRKQGDLRGRRSPCFSLDLKLFGSDAPAFGLLADGGEAPVQAVLLRELGVRAVLGKPFVVSSVVLFLAIVLLETLDHVVPYMKTVCESYAPADLVRQLPVLLGGVAVYALVTYLAFRTSAARFEQVDL